MPDLTDCADLLETAEALMRRELAPVIPEGKRYEAAMLANALAIAARALRVGQADAEVEAALRQLDPHAGTAPRDVVERRLVAAIRSGRFDGGEGAALRTFLVARTRARLRVSAPEALADFHPEASG